MSSASSSSSSATATTRTTGSSGSSSFTSRIPDFNELNDLWRNSGDPEARQSLLRKYLPWIAGAAALFGTLFALWPFGALLCALDLCIAGNTYGSGFSMALLLVLFVAVTVALMLSAFYAARWLRARLAASSTEAHLVDAPDDDDGIIRFF
ncbi:hypothetical protein QOT17_000235 [Balamuthia mandrillaris]